MSLSKFRALRRSALVVSAVTVAGLATLAAPANAGDNTTLAAYQLHNQGSNLCADLPGYGPGVPDGPVNVWHCQPYGDNQLWTRTRTRIGSPVIFQVQNASDGMCLDLPYYGPVPAGTTVTEYPCAARPQEDNQEWYFQDYGNGRYHVANIQSGLCLSGFGAPDDQLRVVECSDTDPYQNWALY